MLPKINRLPSSDIKTVLRSRSRIATPEFQLVFQKRTGRELKLATTTASRFVVIVSTKIDKRAVKRNRMRRLIHESIHHLLLTIADGWDCVIIVRENFSGQKQIDVENEIKTLLHKAVIVTL